MAPKRIIAIVVITQPRTLRRLRTLTEGRWQHDNPTGLIFRIDPENPQLKLRRHITIAEPKHTGVKHKQVSWTDLQTRHDKVSFDTNFRRLGAAKDLASRALGIDKDKLEAAGAGSTLQAAVLVEQLLDEDNSIATKDLFDVPVLVEQPTRPTRSRLERLLEHFLTTED